METLPTPPTESKPPTSTTGPSLYCGNPDCPTCLEYGRSLHQAAALLRDQGQLILAEQMEHLADTYPTPTEDQPPNTPAGRIG